MRRLPLVILLLLGTAGCDMAPHYVRPIAPVSRQWPEGASYPPLADRPMGLGWRDVIADQRLRTLVEQALSSNRSIQATVASVAAARAQYHVQRASELPTVTGVASASIARGLVNGGSDTSSYTANVGMSNFEIDLFGRLKNLSKQAFEQYLATDSGLAAARITLISSTATAYIAFAADQDLLGVSRETLRSATRSLELTRSLHASGLVAMTDVSNAETLVAQAKSDIEQATTNLAQDRNALQLLVGGPVEDALLPKSTPDLSTTIKVIPAGLSSTILLQRPDVVEAEHRLKGANAQIGAARAAFFPTITLTSAIGVASSALTSLFSGGALRWSAAPSAALPILGGTNQGNLAYARAQKDYYIAQYRYTVQSAFREVADGLARRGTIDRQRADQAALVAAATRSYRLADAQYRAGTDTFLNALVAQRVLYTARQTQLSGIQLDLDNRIALYEYTGEPVGL